MGPVATLRAASSAKGIWEGDSPDSPDSPDSDTGINFGIKLGLPVSDDAEVLALGLESAPGGGVDGSDLGAGGVEGRLVVLLALPESREDLLSPDATGFMGFILVALVA